MKRFKHLPAILILAFFHLLMICKFIPLFADWHGSETWRIFIKNYHMSGFDPHLYMMVTDWSFAYDVIRHPLLAFMTYPLYLLNCVLTPLTGMNCATLIVGTVLAACGYLAYTYIYDIIKCYILRSEGWALPTLLSLMCFGFAYILVGLIVADHFCLSLCCICYVLHTMCSKIDANEQFSIRETILLFTIVAGITLSNGVVVFIAVLVTNGWSMFRMKYLLSAVIVPSLVMLAIGVGINAMRYTIYSETVNPVEWQMRDVQGNISRGDVLVENFFGESLQLHREHILGDVLVKRPVIVRYSWWQQYIVEAVVVLLMLCGMFFGRREKLMWALSLILAFNLALHIGLGFALNEVFIMASHWAFVIPMAIAYLFVAVRDRRAVNVALLLVVGTITVYLYAYHGVLLYRYLTWQLAY